MISRNAPDATSSRISALVDALGADEVIWVQYMALPPASNLSALVYVSILKASARSTHAAVSIRWRLAPLSAAPPGHRTAAIVFPSGLTAAWQWCSKEIG